MLGGSHKMQDIMEHWNQNDVNLIPDPAYSSSLLLQNENDNNKQVGQEDTCFSTRRGPSTLSVFHK